MTTSASSRDGRIFTLSPDATVGPGDLVVLTAADAAYVGQVLGQGPDGVSRGIVVATVQADGTVRSGVGQEFAGAAVSVASAEVLTAIQSARRATLEIGAWRAGDGSVPARLVASGFGRHTFLCGQSGSGKTYALGVVLERLLLGTELRVVVLDPNADYVHLDRTLPEVPDEIAQQWSALDVRVLGAAGSGHEPLRLRFATMPHEAQAALLQLDPLADREEYDLFLRMRGTTEHGSVSAIASELRAHGGVGERLLAQRIDNLGMTRWEVFAESKPSAAEIVATRPDLTVLDLSGFPDPAEPVALCLDLVEDLWARRAERVPTLVVIDEAHNICPAEPHGPAQVALVKRLIQIAAEGRKYGLWLLLSTQRPSKIHPQVLSQCDNLMLMRVNSAGDIAHLVEAFGFVPPAVAGAAQYFTQGEAVLAGAMVPVPTLVTMGERLTRQGGSDVAVPLRSGQDRVTR